MQPLKSCCSQGSYPFSETNFQDFSRSQKVSSYLAAFQCISRKPYHLSLQISRTSYHIQGISSPGALSRISRTCTNTVQSDTLQKKSVLLSTTFCTYCGKAAAKISNVVWYNMLPAESSQNYNSLFLRETSVW